MKHRIIAALLAITLLLTASACGAETVSSVSAEPEAPQSFGGEHFTDSTVQAADTTALPEPGSSEAAEGQEPEPVQDLTALAVEAVLYCDAVDMLPYGPDDPMYFWRAMGTLIGLVGEKSTALKPEDGQYRLEGADAEIFALALFSDFDGVYPSVTEEDPMVALPEDGSDAYLIHTPEFSDLDLNMTEPEGGEDGTATVEAELLQGGESLGKYTITLKAYPEDRAGKNTFAYSIVSAEPMQ